MASKNRVGHSDRKKAAKSLKEKRREKRVKRTHHGTEAPRPVEEVYSHSR